VLAPTQYIYEAYHLLVHIFRLKWVLFFSCVMILFVDTAFSDVPNVPAVMRMENGSLVEWQLVKKVLYTRKRNRFIAALSLTSFTLRLNLGLCDTNEATKWCGLNHLKHGTDWTILQISTHDTCSTFVVTFANSTSQTNNYHHEYECEPTVPGLTEWSANRI